MIENESKIGQHKFPVIALEGLGGCGKSHVGTLLNSKFSSEGIPSEMYKIGGLGYGRRLDQLRTIREHREAIYQSGEETEKQRVDRLKDKIYGLAAYHQAREFSKDKSDKVRILERTPFVGWAYASAVQRSNDCENVYLEDIYKSNIKVSEELGLSHVYYLDTTPETAYARTIARYHNGDHDINDELDIAISLIQPPTEKIAEIKLKTLSLISKAGGHLKKNYESWHFPTYALLAAHRDTFIEVLDRAKDQLGFSTSIVDAERDIEVVTEDIYSKIKASL